MNINKTLKISSAAAFSASILYVVLTAAAMLTYPGGTNLNKDSIGYSFGANFFSDLGRTVSFAGEPQTLTMVMFTLALGLVGFALIPFFMLIPSLYKTGSRGRMLSILGSTAGVISAISYIGIACTPWNIYLSWHMKFVQTAFICITISMMLYTAAFALHDGVSRIYPSITGIFSLIAAGYVFLLFYGPGLDTASGLAVQVAAQKIIAYVEIAVIACVVTGVYQTSKKTIAE